MGRGLAEPIPKVFCPFWVSFEVVLDITAEGERVKLVQSFWGSFEVELR